MLQRIRDNASGPIAYAVVGLISLVFGVWGIGSYFTSSGNPAVATAGDTDISKYQLQQAYDQQYQRLQQLMGDNFDHDMIKPQRFRRQVLEGLIQQALLSQYAQQAGYRTTDQALLDALRSDQRFQVDGSFSRQRYRALLSQAGVTPTAFEAGMRGDLQTQQVRRGVLGTSFVTAREIGLVYQIEHQRRKLAYLRFQPSDYRDRVAIEDSEIEAYYHDHAQAFMTPERVKLAYIELDRNALEVAKKPDDKYLHALYEQEKDARFKTPERRKARQILIRVDKDTSEDAARKKIQELAEKLDQGADFAKLARQYSDDKDTAEKGGQMDWVSRGTMTAAFEDKLFSMKKGSVSTPVRTDFGWHLIKLEAVEPAKVKPFDDPEVRSELLSLYRSQERDERFHQLSERLDSLSFEAPDSLEPISEKLDLRVKTSDWIERGGKSDNGLGQYDAVRKAAFSDSVLKDRLNSTPIQLSGDRMLVLRVAKHEPAQRRPLDAVRERIRERLRERAAAQQARDQAQKALQSLRDGADLSKVASQYPAKVVDAGWLTRQSDGQPPGLLDALYAMPQPEDSQTRYKLATLGDGDVAVLQLSAVEDAAPPADDHGGERDKLARQVRGRIAGLEYATLRRSIRDDYDVEISQDQLE